jgi:hypothetical protein
MLKFIAAFIVMMTCCFSYGASVITHSSGTTTYTLPANINSGDSVDVSGGHATLQNRFKNGSALNVTGGIAEIDGTFRSDITVTGGTLLMGANAIVNGNTTLSIGNGTFDTNDQTFNLKSLTLTANSTINLGAGNETISFGALASSAFNLNITGWSNTDTISFENPLPASHNITLNGTPATFTLIGNQMVITGPTVPETNTLTTLFIIMTLIIFHKYKHDDNI